MLGLIALAAAASSAPSTPMRAICRDLSPTLVQGGATDRARKLNALPNANLYLGVLRLQDGCSKPAIVRYDIGADSDKSR